MASLLSAIGGFIGSVVGAIGGLVGGLVGAILPVAGPIIATVATVGSLAGSGAAILNNSSNTQVATQVEMAAYFEERVTAEVIERVGQPVEGINVDMIRKAFPLFRTTQFDNVPAKNGTYYISGGGVIFIPGSGPSASDDKTLAAAGFKKLLENAAFNFAIALTSNQSVDLVLDRARGYLLDALPVADLAKYFEEQIRAEIRGTIGEPGDGFDYDTIMESFPLFRTLHFSEVQAKGGKYVLYGGYGAPIDFVANPGSTVSNAKELTSGGFRKLLENTAFNLDISLTNTNTKAIDALIDRVRGGPKPQFSQPSSPGTETGSPAQPTGGTAPTPTPPAGGPTPTPPAPPLPGGGTILGNYFRDQLIADVNIRIDLVGPNPLIRLDQKILMQAFAGLVAADFTGVSITQYDFNVFAIDPTGYAKLLENLEARLDIDAINNATVNEIIARIKKTGLSQVEPVLPVQLSTKFVTGDKIRTSTNLTVRETAGGLRLGTQVTGSLGTIIGGPIFSGDFWHWRVDYEKTPDGWSAEDWLVNILGGVSTKFKIGDRIITANIIPVSETPRKVSFARQEVGAGGVVVGGPEKFGEEWFWKFDYDIGADGWSGENWIKKAPTPIGDIVSYFEKVMITKATAIVGQPIEGFDAYLFKDAFPGLINQDFDDVLTVGGEYIFTDGGLLYKQNNSLVTSADRTLTTKGYEILLSNLGQRFNILVSDIASVDRVMARIVISASSGTSGTGGSSGGSATGGGPASSFVPYFEDVALSYAASQVGQPVEGFDADLLMQAFPGLTKPDFDNVLTTGGEYEFQNNDLVYNQVSALSSSADRRINRIGYETLLNHLLERFNVPLIDYASIDRVVKFMKVIPGTKPTGSIIYGIGDKVDISASTANCSSLGGTFNSCGSSCPSGSGACIAVCVVSCDFNQ